MGELVERCETQLSLARALVASAPLDAVVRARMVMRAADTALTRNHDEAERAQLRTLLTRAEAYAMKWQAALNAWQADLTEREHAYKLREMRALFQPLAHKP